MPTPLPELSRSDQPDSAASGCGPAGRGSRTPMANWIIAVSLAVIAVCLVMRSDSGSPDQVFAQPTTHAGARGVFAFTGQLAAGTYGVFMVDVDAGTLWCYKYDPVDARLKLVASRYWLYDRYLQEFNADKPSVEEIRRQVEEQRARELEAQGITPP